MPVYAYQCEECGVVFEHRQSFSDEPIRLCPECAGSVRRLIQPAGIIFKGSGFYVTDNKGVSNSAAPGKKAEAKAEKADSPAASSKSDD